MRKSYSVKEFAQDNYKLSVGELLDVYEAKFSARFSNTMKTYIELEIKFENSYDETSFYQALSTDPMYTKLYTVKTHPIKNKTLIVSGKESLFDFLGSKEPNLLTLSRNLGIDFNVSFTQSYSSTSFTGSVINGELLSRQCIVEYNEVLPELSLGLLFQIGKTSEELDLLLTRIIPTQTEVLI
ncbi:MAG TPA: hypothetical protein VFC75_03410 [Erysipelothrix sp.]|nr:hypothetical protein [Erysipelothrix sp.]